MFVRIVKMSFQPEKIEEFLNNFNSKKEFIRNSPGCRLLELYRDKTNPNIFFTYSYWDTEQDLENYRNSDLFKGVWAQTKVLFNAKPLAWSVDKVDSLK
ncbi:antibiotic biosynthesis monooxygenase [Tenacibaculum sp. 1B UA]|uniref:putative quinol monooxygenase n=1 Tax=Tenacibaculum sp. 1B UA TaxID=2922252 RepID=UPI002A241A5D|nr:antibiotic biosynthesis monooxygenase family protein [Tenacibaculum sp. 1B UA]MDX8554988.1 antibiotic biosynthesis monooxygenase [Tenacibaculum sp. 1B UA]